MRIALIGLLLVASSSAARAEHRGFTAAIEVGGGMTRTTSNVDIHPDSTEMGPGWGLLIGGFVRGDLAIGFRSNVQFAPATMENDLKDTGATVMFGAAAQYWASERVSLTGGISFAVLAYEERNPSTFEQAVGNGMSAIAPFVGAAFNHRGFRLGVEVAPLLSSDGLSGIATSLALGYQYLR